MDDITTITALTEISSPPIDTMSALELDDPHVPGQLVDQLVKGYDALSFEMKRAHEHQRQLENRLAWAKQQVGIPTFSSIPFYDDPKIALDL